MKLEEIFDYKDTTIKWKTHGKFQLTKFCIENECYVIQIHNQHGFPYPEFRNKNVAEVSFYKTNIPDQMKGFYTHPGRSSSNKVYGAVYNALFDKFSEYDAYYFTAERRHSEDPDEYESKIRIYRYIANKMSKSDGYNYYEDRDERQARWIVSKIPLIESYGGEFISPLREAVEACFGIEDAKGLQW